MIKIVSGHFSINALAGAFARREELHAQDFEEGGARVDERESGWKGGVEREGFVEGEKKRWSKRGAGG